MNNLFTEGKQFFIEILRHVGSPVLLVERICTRRLSADISLVVNGETIGKYVTKSL